MKLVMLGDVMPSSAPSWLACRLTCFQGSHENSWAGGHGADWINPGEFSLRKIKTIQCDHFSPWDDVGSCNPSLWGQDTFMSQAA